MRNQTLLVETTQKIQTEQLLKCKTYFSLPVEVSEHKTLNSSKGIIRDKALKGETEENIKDYLQDQGVTALKTFRIRKGHDLVSTNMLLLTFNSVVPPKSLKIFYRIIPAKVNISNPLRCFNCQRFGHHDNNYPVDLGSFVNEVEWEVMTIIPTIVQTQHNVLTAEKTICQEPVTVKSRKMKKKS